MNALRRREIIRCLTDLYLEDPQVAKRFTQSCREELDRQSQANGLSPEEINENWQFFLGSTQGYQQQQRIVFHYFSQQHNDWLKEVYKNNRKEIKIMLNRQQEQLA